MGDVLCWGVNQFGLGDSAHPIEYALEPTALSGVGGASAIAAGDNHACAVVGSGVMCWGSNDQGQIGLGAVDAVEAGTLTDHSPTSVVGVTNATAIVAGGSSSCALVQTGDLFCWGNNVEGEFGDAPHTAIGVPIKTSW
jgi:hypothetical protein